MSAAEGGPRDGAPYALVRAALGALLGLIARLWVATLRLHVLEHPGLRRDDGRPWVLAFFHGQQLALLGWPRRRPTAVLVSLSKDGQIQASALPRLGLVVRRGSSSRGGARGLAAIVRLLRQGSDAAFAVDGPRGPLGTVHPGAGAAARHARGVLVPLASASSGGWVLSRAWDRFELPRPFSRVVVAVGEPLEPDAPDELLAARLSSSLERLRAEAERLARARPVPGG